MCTGRLGHKDKVAISRFFVVPADDPLLLGMPDIELLGLPKIMCEVVRDQQADQKFRFQTIQATSGSSCKENTGKWIKTYNVDAVDAN